MSFTVKHVAPAVSLAKVRPGDRVVSAANGVAGEVVRVSGDRVMIRYAPGRAVKAPAMYVSLAR